jgi:hypothetical protein
MAPFQYQPYRNPYVGTIADLMLEPGRAQAQAAVQSGNAWANAANQIGQSVAAIPGQIQQQKALQTQQQIHDLQLKQAQQHDTDRQALDQAYASGLDREGILSRLPGHLRPTVQKQFAEADEAALKVRELKDKAAVAERDYLGSLAAGVKTHLQEPDAGVGAAMVALQHAKQQGYDVDAIWQRVSSDPSQLPQIVDGLIAQSPKQQELVTAATTAAARAKTADTGAQRLSLEQPKIAAETTRLQQETTGTVPMSPAQQATDDRERQRIALERQKLAQGQADVTELTPEGLDAAALNYAKTGQLPPLGMGDKTTRKQIINRAAAMMPGLDVASAKADFDANKASLTGLQKQRDAISAFEQTATKNIDIFLNAAGKVVDTGSPLANSIARQVSGKMLGSPDQAAYDAARQVAINEIAKITSNPNLSGTLSDSARQEVEHFNPQSATLKQTVAVMRLLKQDMANRASAMDDQIAGIRGRIKLGQTPETPKPTDDGGWIDVGNGVRVREKR